MPDSSRLIPLASAATLALVLAQGAWATEEPAQAVAATPAPAEQSAPAVPAPTEAASAPAPAATPAMAPSPAEAARARADERRAAMMAEREKRYQELRASAAEIGLDLPEAPPWVGGDWALPEPPASPQRRGLSPEDIEAMRAQRREMREQMRYMTPEERRLTREAHWRQMRADAAERGVELPETPPWVAAEQRRKEMEARYEQYRKTLDAMTEEQIEAARAIFGSAPSLPEEPMMPPTGPGYGPDPRGAYPGFGGYPAEPEGMGGYPAYPMMPYPGHSGFDQAPPPPRRDPGY